VVLEEGADNIVGVAAHGRWEVADPVVAAERSLTLQSGLHLLEHYHMVGSR
jgi:hypothetical protein